MFLYCVLITDVPSFKLKLKAKKKFQAFEGKAMCFHGFVYFVLVIEWFIFGRNQLDVDQILKYSNTETTCICMLFYSGNLVSVAGFLNAK